MAVIGVSMIALIVVTVLIVVGFLVVVSFVGDIFVAGAVVGLALLVMGAGLFVTLAPSQMRVTVTEVHEVHDGHPAQTTTFQIAETTTHGQSEHGAQVAHVVEPDSQKTDPFTATIPPVDPNTLSTTSGLYATADLALSDALSKLVAKLDGQVAVPKYLPGADEKMVQILKSEQPNYQVHDAAQDRDLGDGLVAKMHKVTVNFPLELVEKVRTQMEQWVALMRAKQVFIGLGSGAGALFLIGAFLSWVSRPAKSPSPVGPS